MKAILCLGFSIGLTVGLAALGFAADRPDAPPATAPDTLDPHEWQLTSYLKGSASEIRDKMNGEVERLAVKVRETEAAIKQGNLDCTSDEKEALAKVHKSSAYQQAATEVAKAEADLETARKSGSSQDRLAASARFNKARTVLETFDHDAITKSEDLARDRHALSDAQKNLKRYNDSLDRAVTWRNELLEDTRNGFMLRAPLIEGAKGTLPRVVVQKIVDDTHLIVEFELVTVDIEHPGKDVEGIKVFNATKSRVLLIVSGVATKDIKKNDKLSFDRNFVVHGTAHGDADGLLYKVELSPNDSDELFQKLTTLREPLPARFAKTTADSSK